MAGGQEPGYWATLTGDRVGIASQDKCLSELLNVPGTSTKLPRVSQGRAPGLGYRTGLGAPYARPLLTGCRSSCCSEPPCCEVIGSLRVLLQAQSPTTKGTSCFLLTHTSHPLQQPKDEATPYRKRRKKSDGAACPPGLGTLATARTVHGGNRWLLGQPIWPEGPGSTPLAHTWVSPATCPQFPW